ncbi:MAG: DUF5320 domain-containing protein [Acidobacteria bacterium]|nr:DUF5320 domain-containing protein [Acidobacteriota bacterium]
MPFGDRTGPAGRGPRTGRGAGYCNRFGVPGSMNWGDAWSGWGRRLGGGGRGWRNWFHSALPLGGPRAADWPPGVGGGGSSSGAAPSHDEELEDLKYHAGLFERTLEYMHKRIESLEGKTKKD